MPDSVSISALQNRRSSIFLPDPFCSSPSPPSSPIPRHSFRRCGSRQFIVADFQHQNLQMHEATVNCLAFCKALCDDFLRLKAKNREIVTLCTLQCCSVRFSFLDFIKIFRFWLTVWTLFAHFCISKSKPNQHLQECFAQQIQLNTPVPI